MSSSASLILPILPEVVFYGAHDFDMLALSKSTPGLAPPDTYGSYAR
jgi:hypothetical protein